MNPDKTKGMNSIQITTFLMCPATVGDASGGTPAACAAGGGHIKKGTWVSAHEAAVRGLVLLLMDGHPSPLLFRLGQFGPDEVPVVWAEVAAGNEAIRLALNGRRDLWSALTESVSDIPKVTKSGPAFLAERLALVCRHGGQKGA